MEFLTDSYIWIIVVVVVILMTIIGYVAEKTNFGKKEFSKKKNDKKIEEAKEIKTEVKKVEEPKIPEVETPKAEISVEPFNMPEEIEKKEPDKMEETVHFSDPLTDDMNVASDVLETPYQDGEEVLSVEEDLNTPFGESSSENAAAQNSFDTFEDLNAPFGDFELPKESPVEENLNAPLEEAPVREAPNDTLSYEMPEEDLNVPFGDNEEIKTREEFNLNLPDIDSIKEEVNTTSNNDSDDDIWKF